MPRGDMTVSARPKAAADAVALASRVGRRAGATGADPRERTDALLQQLRLDRLVWAVAPAERGGLSLTLYDTARVTFHLAKASGSLGLIYAMHTSQALTLLRHARGSSYLDNLTDRLIADQALVASGTSEKGVGGDILRSTCTVETSAEGGLEVTKESPNISYMDHARAVLVTALREVRGRKVQVLIACDTDAIDLRPSRETRMMGMHGILNRPYGLTAHFGASAVFEQDYPAIARETMTPSIHVLWAALWSGLAAHALSKAKAFLATAATDGEGAELMRVELSRLVNRHYVMNALVREAALEFDAASRQPPALTLGLGPTAQIKRLKAVCSDLLQEVCQGALGLIGLPAYAEDGPYSLSEVVRDALSARVMISNYRLLLGNSAIERFIDDEI